MVCVFFPICVSYFIKNQNKEKNKQKNKNRKERKEEKRKHTKRKRKERKNKPGKKVKDRDSWLQLHLTWLAHLSNLEPTTAGLVAPGSRPVPPHSICPAEDGEGLFWGVLSFPLPLLHCSSPLGTLLRQ